MQAYAAIPKGVLFLENNAIIKEVEGKSRQEVLKCEEGFNPTCLSVNHDHTLLAVASEYEVRVYLLELGINSCRRIETLDKQILGSRGKVVSLAWHPYARTNAGLVVLTSAHIVIAQIKFGTHLVLERKELRDDSNLVLDPINISFGAEDSPLGKLTAYLGTTDGDIYRIFPLLPPEAEIPTDEIALIESFVDLKDWSTLFESWSDTKHCRVTVLSKTTQTSISSMSLGDSLLIKPYAEELYEGETLDLKAGSVGWATDLIVQTSTNFVSFYASPSPLSDKLVTVAFVKFTKPQTKRRIELITPEHVFISCGSALHVLDISQWSSELYNVFEDNLDTNDRVVAKPVTKVSAYPSQKVYIDNQSVASVDSEETWRLNQQFLHHTRRLSHVSEDLEELNSSSFTASLGDLTNRAVSLAAKLKNKTPQTPLATNWGANIGSLNNLDTLSGEFKSRNIKLAKVMAHIQLQRTIQKRELAQQCSELALLRKNASNNEDKMPQLQEKIDGLKTRQSELATRMRKVAGVLAEFESKQPEKMPSKAEQEWTTELKKELPSKLDSLEPQIEQLKNSVEAAKLAASSEGAKQTLATDNISKPQISPKNALELHWRLKKQEGLINSLLHKLDVKE